MATRRANLCSLSWRREFGDGTAERISKETQCERKNDLQLGNSRPM
ncbi:hypothetical protein MZA95_10505 [Haemophilus influenzae]